MLRVANVAGLRSRDRSIPEEINRLCTDVLCDYLFTTDHFADENVKAEGVSPERILVVSNVMIDTLLKHRELMRGLDLIGKLALKRNSRERPITCEVGTKFFAGTSKERILCHAFRILEREIPRGKLPEKWDGKAAERIVEVLGDLAKDPAGRSGRLL